MGTGTGAGTGMRAAVQTKTGTGTGTGTRTGAGTRMGSRRVDERGRNAINRTVIVNVMRETRETWA